MFQIYSGKRVMKQTENSAGNGNRIIWVVGVLVLIMLILAGCAVLLHSPRLKDSGRSCPLSVAARVEPAAAVVSVGGKYYYAGQPVSQEPLRVLTNIAYMVGYADETRNDPVWVCYRLFATNNLHPPGRPKTIRFSKDLRTHSRVASADYTGFNFDRGHCAPSRAIGFCYGTNAQKETYLMSNILPELHARNAGLWEDLEAMELTNYAQRCKEIWVITGPVFGAQPKHLKHDVDIPTALYKIIVDEEDGRVRVLAFIIPQTVTEKERLAQFLTSVDEVEKETGLDFLSELPDEVENRVEAEKTCLF
jgi:endonuclease G